jgi:hypothetical protein
MTKRIPRQQEQRLVEVLSEAIRKQVLPTKEVVERPEGLTIVQLSLADRADEIEAWLEVSITALKQQNAGKADINKLVRLGGLVRDAITALIYSAQTLAKQRLEILYLRRQLEQTKKGTPT